MSENGYYTIVAPATLLSEYVYDVTFTLHDQFREITIQVSISGPSYNESQTAVVQPLSAEVIHFNVPYLEIGLYELRVKGIKGLRFEEHVYLNNKCKLPKFYIQMDKFEYKPHDVVQYHILALDENLKPAKMQKPLEMIIKDGALNIIKVIRDLQFKKGVYTDKFHISDLPVLGTWQMQVKFKNEEKPKSIKKFQVVQSVKPKFIVELKTDKKVTILDRKIKISVCAYYNYGEMLKGRAIIKAIYQRDTSSDKKSATSEDKTIEALKAIDLEGKTDLEFDILEDLKLDQYKGYELPTIQIEAVVTDIFTGLEQSSRTLIAVERSRYTIDIPQLDLTYPINKPFEITAVIKKLNGQPVTDATSTAKLLLCATANNSRNPDLDRINELIFESEVDSNGRAVFKLRLSSETNYYGVSVAYEEKTQNFFGFQLTNSEGKCQFMQSIGGLTLYPRERSSDCHDDIAIDVIFDNPLSYFVYTIMARGKIIHHEFVKVPKDTNSYCIKIKPTFDMFPLVKLLAYFVRDGMLKYDETFISLPLKLANKLQVFTSQLEAKPNEEITFNIETTPDSFVSLKAVEQTDGQQKTVVDNLIDKQILNGLRSYGSQMSKDPNYTFAAGRMLGFIALTNAWQAEEKPLGVFSIPPESPYDLIKYAKPVKNMTIEDEVVDLDSTKERNSSSPPNMLNDSQENWNLNDIESTDAKGFASFTENIPKSITTWNITGFSLNAHTGLAITENAINIHVVQSISMRAHLPNSIKCGEFLTIPIVIFNYMDAIYDVFIIMENLDNEYEFIDPHKDNDNQKEIMTKISVPPNDRATISFAICPKIVGEILLKIKAISSEASDCIHHKLKVTPEGIREYYNEVVFLNLCQGEFVTENIKAKLPHNIVKDSENFEISVVTDIMAGTLNNIQKLQQLPLGGGERNMVNFASNLLTLNYLKAIKANMPSVVDQAKNSMELCYQNQLCYKHENGAFSFFGEAHSEANSWLTAFVVKSFIQAREFITISENIIEEALSFLISTQKSSGGFLPLGKLYQNTNQTNEGISDFIKTALLKNKLNFNSSTKQNEVLVSAFIVLALVEHKDYSTKYNAEIDKGLLYLLKNIKDEDDIYVLSLVAWVFKKVKHPYVYKLLKKIEKQAHCENDVKWWGRSSETCHNDKIQITGYILQTLLETENFMELLPIIKWLIMQRKNLAGIDSTLATVVSLETLFKVAEKYVANESSKLSIYYEAKDLKNNEIEKGSFELNKENALILQSQTLPPSIRQLSLTATGQGSALVQLSFGYNTTEITEKPDFHIQHKVLPSSYPGRLILQLCIEYKPMNHSKYNVCNIAVMEIYLPSGYTIEAERIAILHDVIQIKRVEIKNENTTIVIYFENLLTGQAISFDLIAERTYQVSNLKPSAIIMYNYYNMKQRAIIYYDIK